MSGRRASGTAHMSEQAESGQRRFKHRSPGPLPGSKRTGFPSCVQPWRRGGPLKADHRCLSSPSAEHDPCPSRPPSFFCSHFLLCLAPFLCKAMAMICKAMAMICHAMPSNGLRCGPWLATRARGGDPPC